MRIAVISDIHGNRSALEAVVADLAQTSPDLILHGGDLPHGGANPAWIVDCIRDLGWQGVAGNTDEMLWRPESLTEFAKLSAAPAVLFTAIGEMAAATCEALGDERIAWLRRLPLTGPLYGGLSLKYNVGALALVHASPADLWRAPSPEASDAELEAVYGPLEKPVVVYGHIHRSFVRNVGKMTVVNSGSAGLPYDGDRRAAYLLLDDLVPTIRRVEYDLNRELKELSECAIPHAAWIARMLETAAPCMP